MMEMVNASVDVDQLDHLVADMMSSQGLGSKQSLDLEDFQQLMGKYSGDLSEATLIAPGLSALTLMQRLIPQLNIVMHQYIFTCGPQSHQ